MNLHGIVSGAVSAVNPRVLGAVLVATGTTTAADGTLTQTVAAFPNQWFQVQALSSGDIRHLGGLNLQPNLMAVYLNGNINGLDRLAGKGGDLLLWGNTTWLVTNSIENWTQDGWTKVAVTKQIVAANIGPPSVSATDWAAFVASLPTVPGIGVWNNAGVPTYP